VKHEPILIIFGIQNPEEISPQKIRNSPTSPEQCCHTTLWKKSSDAACRILDNIHDIYTSSCQCHPLIIGWTIINSIKWTLETRYTRDEGDWLLISLCTGDVRHLYYNNNRYIHCKESYFAFHNILQRHYSGKVVWLTLQTSDVNLWNSSGFCVPKY